ncbi:MAG: dihydrolipoamide acetyltransferase family protein [Clostridia bacterium]
MAIPVIMPRQGQSVESCIITEWKKNVGDSVKVGDILFSYETDKSSFEEEAKADGTLLAVFFQADDDVPCLINVAVIGNPGESFAQFAPDSAATTAVTDAVPASNPSAPSAETVAPMAAATVEHTAGVSPRARAAADKLHMDVSNATPTGPHGRVIERDVLQAAKDGHIGTGLGGRMTAQDAATVAATPVKADLTAPAGIEYEDVKLPNLRKVIGKAMHASLSEMAQLTHNTSFDATAILALREQLKTAPDSMDLPKISINDIILFAASRVLMHHKDLNANCIGGDTMRYYQHVNLGIACDTPRGLLVPTLFHADKMSLKEIAVESKKLIAAAKEGNISPDLLKDASFTISNLGVYGIESFTPVVNPPQTGILGVCCITERVRTIDGQITTYPAMGLSLTYDHRAVDGAPASRFLKELVTALENFSALMAG